MTKADLTTIYFGDNLSEWVSLTHSTIIKQYKLRSFKIEPNDYGYDAYAAIIASVMDLVTPDEILVYTSSKQSPEALKQCLNKYIPSMHSAWCANYTEWKRTLPGAVSKGYKTNVNTNDRNDRATTDVNHLSADDLETYEHLLSVIFDLLTKKILTAGMQKLTI